MGLFSGFKKNKQEEKSTHTEPGMSSAPKADNYDATEPGFSMNKAREEMSTQEASGLGAADPHSSASRPVNVENSFLGSSTQNKEVNLSRPPEEDRAEPTAATQINRSRGLDLQRSPQSSFFEEKNNFESDKINPETSEHISNSQEQYKQYKRIRARRRLIGAVMLLALVVVAVPFLFDKEPPPPTVTISLRIPSENSVDVAQITVPGSVKQEFPTASKDKPEVSTNKGAANVVAPADSSDKKSKEQDEKKVEKKKQETKPVAKEPAPSKKEQEAKKDKKDSKEANKKEKEKPAAAKGSYFVQVIASSNENNAKAILKRIKDGGLPAYIESVAVKKGTVWRVRAGNFQTEKAAQDARTRLGLLGLTGNVGRIK